jgi:thiol peroxidase
MVQRQNGLCVPCHLVNRGSTIDTGALLFSTTNRKTDGKKNMSRAAAVTFKGTPMTLAGEELKAGQQAPPFTLHYFQDGLKTLTLNDLLGKPTLISVVPSLDTGVCAIQTKKFNEELSEIGDSVNAVTVSLDLPFAQGRFCGEHEITNMRTASDYQDRNFGKSWGVLIEELKLLARAVFVLDAKGKIISAETVAEVTSQPDYGRAMAALKESLATV